MTRKNKLAIFSGSLAVLVIASFAVWLFGMTAFWVMGYIAIIAGGVFTSDILFKNKMAENEVTTANHLGIASGCFLSMIIMYQLEIPTALPLTSFDGAFSLFMLIAVICGAIGGIIAPAIVWWLKGAPKGPDSKGSTTKPKAG